MLYIEYLYVYINMWYKEIQSYRVIVVILLVIYHSFCMFDGVWNMPKGYEMYINNWYSWISKISYSILLEAYVFISGYVFSLKPFIETVRKKCVRLIYPAIIWGIIYDLIIDKIDGGIFTYIYSILKGLGHLWFLVMLFWCFIWATLILKYIKNIYLVIMLSVCLYYVSPLINLPFQINLSFRYLLFFIAGYYVKNRRDYFNVLSRYYYIIFFVFILLFACYQLVVKMDMLININIVRYTLSLSFRIVGIMAIYLLIVKINFSMSKVLSDNSFGIYILHHIIIEYLYYKCYFFPIIGIELLPIITVPFVLIMSLCISVILSRFKILKYLI